jgi:tRNA pseudouridine55 synthase
MQLPPLYSAIKKKGKKLYELMRSGKDLKLSDIDPREVEVLSIKITSYSYPKLSLEIEAKAGLYVRSIARDLGGHLSKLVRLQSNAISLDQALELEDVNQENLTDNLLEPSTLIQLPKFLCNKTYRLHLEQGRALKLTEKVALKHDFFQCIDESNDELIGVAKYDEHNLLVKPKIIL